MQLRTPEEARAALLKRAARFAASRRTASHTLDALEAAVKEAAIPGLAVVGRASEELLAAFSGFGFYFRFVYTARAEFLEYGEWTSSADGTRGYAPMGEWPLGLDGRVAAHEPAAAGVLLLPAIEATITQIIASPSIPHWQRASAQRLGRLMPGAVVPLASSGEP